MTTRERDYSKGKVYKIEPINSEDDGDIYIGSTTKQYLSQRLATHKYQFNHWEKTKKNKFVSSFLLLEKYGFEGLRIVLLENVEAKTNDELLSREAHHIKTNDCVNKAIPNRTKKEWREDNAELIAEKRKNHYENNKQEINEKHRQHYIENADKIKEQNKKYVEQHKEEIRERQKKWREENIEAIKISKHNHYVKNADILIEKQKQYSQQNAENIKTYQQEYYLQNADKIKEQNLKNAEHINERRKKYREENREQLKIKQREYLARKSLTNI